jgi:Golgi nucleoside diphosphatase
MKFGSEIRQWVNICPLWYRKRAANLGDPYVYIHIYIYIWTSKQKTNLSRSYQSYIVSVNSYFRISLRRLGILAKIYCQFLCSFQESFGHRHELRNCNQRQESTIYMLCVKCTDKIQGVSSTHQIKERRSYQYTSSADNFRNKAQQWVDLSPLNF